MIKCKNCGYEIIPAVKQVTGETHKHKATDYYHCFVGNSKRNNMLDTTAWPEPRAELWRKFKQNVDNTKRSG
jgi:hypothetical protein